MGVISPGAPGLYEPGQNEQLKELIEHVMDAAPWPNYKSPVTQKVAADFAKRSNGRYFDASGAFAYEAVQLIGDALERAASTDPDAIVAAIKKTNFTGGVTVANGPVVFNEVGDNPNASTALIQILGQKPKVVWPRDNRRGEVRLPPAQEIAMRVFVFDLLPYGENLDHLKDGRASCRGRCPSATSSPRWRCAPTRST